MLALLTALPGIGTIIQAILGAFFNAKVSIYQAKTGADRDVAVTAVQAASKEAELSNARLAIIAGSTVLLTIMVALISPLIIFIWKVVVWDKVLGWGTTDPITGQVSDWANTIIVSFCGTTGVLGIAKMWFSRPGA